jgi:hypothetical protein
MDSGLTVEELAYAAGFFDGEGSILISRRKNTFFIYLRITSTDLHSLEWMASCFGGSVQNQTPNKLVKTCRPCWYWGLASKNAERFLKAIFPFLQIKREQASVALEFQSRILGRGVNWLSKEEIQIRGEYKNRISELYSEIRADAPDAEHPAYIAGLFDGEGSVYISEMRGSYHLYAIVTNTNLSVLEAINQEFGGWIQQKKDHEKRNFPCYSWGSSGHKAVAFLKSVLPWLITKRLQAEYAIEFQENKDAGVDAWSEGYKKKISELNRGIKIAS